MAILHKSVQLEQAQFFFELFSEFTQQSAVKLTGLINLDWNQHPEGLQASEIIHGIVIESTLELEAIAVLDRLNDTKKTTTPLKAIFLDPSSFKHHHAPELDTSDQSLSLLGTFTKAEDLFVQRALSEQVNIIFCQKTVKQSLFSKLTTADILVVQNVRDMEEVWDLTQEYSLFDYISAKKWPGIEVEHIRGQNFGKWKGLVIEIKGVKSVILRSQNESLLKEYQSIFTRLVRAKEETGLSVPGGWFSEFQIIQNLAHFILERQELSPQEQLEIKAIVHSLRDSLLEVFYAFIGDKRHTMAMRAQYESTEAQNEPKSLYYNALTSCFEFVKIEEGVWESLDLKIRGFQLLLGIVGTMSRVDLMVR